MIYLLICFERDHYWIEVNEKLTALRQIIMDENLEVHISAREDCLAEGKIVIHELQGVYKKISKKQFENQWRLAIKPYLNQWLSVKEKYPIGTKVEGICRYFYPQGAIIEGKDYFAVYEGKKEVLFNSILMAYVKRYDEDNLWLVLE